MHQDSQKAIVWFLLEIQSFAVLHIRSEFLGAILAQFGDTSSYLALSNSDEHLLYGGARDLVPGQVACQEIDHHVAKGLHVISARELVSQVSIR